MNSYSVREVAAITGIGELKPTRDPGGKRALELMAEAARLALLDAGLEKRDIDGILIAPPMEFLGMMMLPSYVGEYLGIRPSYANVVDLGGASAAGMVARAAAAIAIGQCRNVLCLTGEAVSPELMTRLIGTFRWSPEEASFEQPYGPMGVNSAYAMAAMRHIHEFGTRPEDLAKIAVEQRKNAQKNPEAIFHGKPITIEDVLKSRLVVDPLHLLEIVMPVSGAAAVIVSDRSVAQRAGKAPAWILGAGEAYSHAVISQVGNITTTPVARSAEHAFRMSGVTRRQIDLVSVYDCYTIMVLLTLEDAGFCDKGQGGAFVAEHDLSYQGDFPVNTHGGQLSFGQAGLAGGTSHIAEAVRQIRGEAAERQLKNCDLVFVNGNGGVMSEEVSLVLGSGQ